MLVKLPLLLSSLLALAAITAPAPEMTWPGFRGHDMNGLALTAKLPDRWSVKDNVKWAVPIAGNGWSSPIVWGDTVYVTSAIGTKPFKQPGTGLFGNDYVAELTAQGLSGEEMMKRVQARDNEMPSESSELRYVLFALDARTGKVKWEREALRTLPGGGRHRKNTYASETPFTDGERIYASFGQNVGLFCFAMDGTLRWKKQWPPQPIYLDFGTASSPTVHNGRVYLVHDNEKSSYIAALDARTGAEIWTTARPGGGQLNSSWMTPYLWSNPSRSEIVTTRQGMVISYDLEGKELWRLGGMAMPTASAFSSGGLLYVGTGSQGDANRPLLAVKPGASGDITLKPGTTSNDFVVWMQPRVAGYTPSSLVHAGKAYSVHDTGILNVLDAASGKPIYRARVGGGGYTFSASPVAYGSRVLFIAEDGVGFVLDSGNEYKEIAKNDLGELSLASPAIAGDALYIRTQSKLYKIAR
ncbi:MAG: PQQ-binding-like beta-propeller repeat protein [Vicinamibacterales bacterium]